MTKKIRTSEQDIELERDRRSQFEMAFHWHGEGSPTYWGCNFIYDIYGDRIEKGAYCLITGLYFIYHQHISNLIQFHLNQVVKAVSFSEGQSEEGFKHQIASVASCSIPFEYDNAINGFCLRIVTQDQLIFSPGKNDWNDKIIKVNPDFLRIIYPHKIEWSIVPHA